MPVFYSQTPNAQMRRPRDCILKARFYSTNQARKPKKKPVGREKYDLYHKPVLVYQAVDGSHPWPWVLGKPHLSHVTMTRKRFLNCPKLVLVTFCALLDVNSGASVTLLSLVNLNVSLASDSIPGHLKNVGIALDSFQHFYQASLFFQ